MYNNHHHSPNYGIRIRSPNTADKPDATKFIAGRPFAGSLPEEFHAIKSGERRQEYSQL